MKVGRQGKIEQYIKEITITCLVMIQQRISTQGPQRSEDGLKIKQKDFCIYVELIEVRELVDMIFLMHWTLDQNDERKIKVSGLAFNITM